VDAGSWTLSFDIRPHLGVLGVLGGESSASPIAHGGEHLAFTFSLRSTPNSHIAFLCAPALFTLHCGAKEAPVMADILVIVLGTGAILLMAAYAVLCEHI
jgi:hypothetical protein